jgi:endonuclease/exonuclease/phosphatase family metal-dependent hydrolase
MSYNIRFGTAADGKNSWKYRRPLVSKLINQQDPDIVGTQEALRFQLDELCSDLGCYGEIGVGRKDGHSEGEYVAILYKKDKFTIQDSGTFWFSDTPEIAGSCHWGNCQPRICTWAILKGQKDGSKMTVYNVHLDHQSDRSRQRSIHLLTQRMVMHENTPPVILTGDFNVTEKDRIIKQIKSGLHKDNPDASHVKFFVDTYRTWNRFSFAGTFNLFTGFRFGPRIDYIFTEHTLRICESSIVRTSFNGRYPSDHFPITAKIELPVE